MLAFEIRLHSYLFASGQYITACQYNTSTWKGLSEYRSSTVVVGDCAVELRLYIYPRKIIYNGFLLTY